MEKINFAKLFSRSSKKLEPFPTDWSLWPEEWKTVYYKSYSRMPKIVLPKANGNSADIFSTIEKRKSQRSFSSETITLEELSNLLYFSAGVLSDPSEQGPYHRAHPSGGARYPLEIYLIVNSRCELKNGIYHYNPKAHSLDSLLPREFLEEEMSELIAEGDSWARKAPILIIFSGIFWRSGNKYGDRGLRFLLIEAGHVGQNFLLVGTALGLKLCPVGGTLDYGVEKVLDIDGETEGVIYAIAIGK